MCSHFIDMLQATSNKDDIERMVEMSWTAAPPSGPCAWTEVNSDRVNFRDAFPATGTVANGELSKLRNIV